MKNTRFNYTGHGWEGSKYDPDLSIKEIAKTIRTNLKKEFPNCKFSVTIQRYSGGQSLYIHLMEAPFPAITAKGTVMLQPDQSYGFVDQTSEYNDGTGHGQLNEYAFENGFNHCEEVPGLNNGNVLSREAWETMKKAHRLAVSYNFDDSDGMIDYFHTNFYLHLEIGKWDKSFQQT